MIGVVALALLIAHPQAAMAMATKIESIRHHTTAENTRVVFDLSGPLERELTVFSLHNPDRLVLDMCHAGCLVRRLCADYLAGGQPAASPALHQRVRLWGRGMSLTVALSALWLFVA